MTASGTVDLTVRIGPLTLQNPILLASGTCGYVHELASTVPVQKLGAVVPKTVTLQPRAGNPPPRTVETASGLLNSIGLDNDGIDHFLTHHLPRLRDLGVTLIVNVAGKSADEFARLCERLDGAAGVAAVELNLSCPNVAGGTDFAVRPELTESVVRQCRVATGLPLIAKLTPNVTDIASVGQAAEAGGATAVSAINTVLGMAVDWRNRRPRLGGGLGGLSGPAIKPIALRCVWQLHRAVSCPVIGIGGVQSVDDVMEFLVVGASAVQIGTATFYDPACATRILEELPAAVSSVGASSVSELIGSLQLGA